MGQVMIYHEDDRFFTQLFAAPITPQLVLAVTLVGTSTLQYNLPKELLRDEDSVSSLEMRRLFANGEESSGSEELSSTPNGKHP